MNNILSSPLNSFQFSDFAKLDAVIKRNKVPGLRLKKAIQEFRKLSAEDKIKEHEVWEVAFINAEQRDNSPAIDSAKKLI